MSLPDAWVERLIARLQVRYGEAWTRQFAGIDPDAVKADWASVLSGLSLDALDHGIKHLPTDRPPNAMQFRQACNRAPERTPAALPAPKADRERIRRLVADMHRQGRKFGDLTPAGHCIVAIFTSEGARKRGGLDVAQEAMVRACCTRLTHSDREQLGALGYSLAQFETMEETTE